MTEMKLRKFALGFVLLAFCLTNARTAVITRREIASKNGSPEAQTTHNIEPLTGDGSNSNTTTLLMTSTIQHDGSGFSKSTKLMPQIAGLNETQLPKKTTLQIVNGPMTTTTTGIEASGSEIATNEKLKLFARNETTTAENVEDRVSEKQTVAKLEATTTSTTTTTTATTTPTSTTSTTPATLPTKQLIEVHNSNPPTASNLHELTSTSTTRPIATLLQQTAKHMDLRLDDDADDIQIVSSGSSSKQPKFLNDNSTNSNQLNLPSNADAWTLASMKQTPMPRNNSNGILLANSTNVNQMAPIKEKTLTDWTQIFKTGVDNALNDEENENAATPMLEDIKIVTTEAANISALYATTTTTTLAPLHQNAEITTISSIEKEFHKKLHNNELLLTLTSTDLSNHSTTEGTSLSVNDNTDIRTTTTTTETPHIKEQNKEKNMQVEAPATKEKATLELSANQTNSSMSASNLTTTLAPTEITMMSSSSSTPATAIVFSTTKRNFEVRHENSENNDGEGEKTVNGDVDLAKIEVTTNQININNIEENNVEEETTIVAVVAATTTTPKIILPTNVINVKAINLTSEIATETITTTQSTPDIHQNSTKSNLETPTTTTPAAIAQVETTIAIETTKAANEENILNSSAIANVAKATTSEPVTESTATTTTTTKRVESKSDNNDNDEKAAVIVGTTTTVDSLATAQSTTSGEYSLPEITTTIKPAVTTTTTAQVTKVTETNLEATSFNKDNSTPKPIQKLIIEQNSNENKTATIIDENKIDYEASTNKNLIDSGESETLNKQTKANTNKAAMKANETSENPENSSPTAVEIATNINGATTPSISTTPAAEAAADVASTSTILSVSTSTEDLYETFSETTTATITTSTALLAENSTNAATLQTTAKPLPTIETTTIFEIETTTFKTIVEMIPINSSTTTTTTTTTTPAVTTQYEAAPSMPATASTPSTTTTMDPLILHGNLGGILHSPVAPKSTPDHPETDVNVVIAISVSVIGVIALILLVAFLYLMRKRQKQTTYGQRCRPVSLDAYSLDNVSVMGSMRKRPSHRSKRSYGNAAFQDPALRHNVIQSAADLAEFAKRRTSIFQEFDDVPKVTARAEEIPQGCEDKNRYANVIPLPETRVILQRRNDDDTTEYINANYVRGPSDAPNYYIASQAPLDTTVQDFWRMIWEQQSRVIIQATDLIEEGKERCAEYLPPSVTLDNHTTFGDFQVMLKNREVKDKYAISTILLKNTAEDNASREITHYWYKWPEAGVPTEEAPIIAMLLEARSSLKSYAIEAANELKEKSNSLNGSSSGGGIAAGGDHAPPAPNSSREINGNLSEKAKNIARHQGPLTIHCSPGTGRTGTIIACDMAIRSLETTKSLDIPQIVYDIRRGRASAVQTKDQYEFIYKVANVYAMKITNISNDN